MCRRTQCSAAGPRAGRKAFDNRGGGPVCCSKLFGAHHQETSRTLLLRLLLMHDADNIATADDKGKHVPVL